ncbi:sensory rhodopsin transducer [Natronospora cellulosivora (SeqCode)]
MTEYAGKKVWFIPDGYLPVKSNGDFISHEAICVLNTSKQDADIDLIFYFEDRDPIKGFKASCPAERTNHIRLDKIESNKGEKLPTGVPYAVMVESNSPIIVQHSRMDTSQKELALMSTIAY